MNILVLMPIDEQHAVTALRMDCLLSNDNSIEVMDMPQYADWLVNVKKAKSWEEAVIMSFISLSHFNQDAKKDNKHHIIIGNTWKSGEFELPIDYIVNFDNDESEEDYKDLFLDIIKGKAVQNADLKRYFGPMYSQEDSKLKMKNIEATVEFLKKYIKIPLKERQEEYDRIYTEYEQWKKKNLIR